MIDLIQSIFSEGDSIKVFFNNSNKSVEGFIFKILPTSLAIKTVDGKICGIKGSDIDSFEEGNILDNSDVKIKKENAQIDLLIESKKETNCDSVSQLNKVSNSNNEIINIEEKTCAHLSNAITKNPLTQENPSEINQKYNVGEVIPLDVLHNIDPSLKHKKPILVNSQGKKMKTLGKDLGALYDLVKDNHEIENLKIIPALGEIKVIRNDMNFGFIRDGKSGKDIYFKLSQIIDAKITLSTYHRLPVIYSTFTTSQGISAVSIHTPKSIKEMLYLASDMAKKGEYHHAFHVVEQILAEYPNNFSADKLMRELQKTFPQYGMNTKIKEYSKAYNKAKKFQSDKIYDKAIEHYLIAINNNEKVESAVKDLGMLYAQLAKSETDEVKAEEYRLSAKDFMEKYNTELLNNISTLYYLENFYYSIREYNLFIPIAQELLEQRELQHDKKRTSQLLCKIAVAYIQIENIEQAVIAVEEALSYDSTNAGALKLKTAIDANGSKPDIMKAISATEFDSLNSGLSAFIQQTLDEYDEYAGVKAKYSGNFTLRALTEIRALIETFDEKKFAGRPNDRARYLLTEGKLMQLLEPDKTFELKSVMARYCNDMAKIHIYNSSPIDVIKFYYSEAFALEEKYHATARQLSYYFLSLIYDGKKLGDEINKSRTIDHALKLVLDNDFNQKTWDSILAIFLNNTSISAQITARLYKDMNWRRQSIRALNNFGVSINDIEISQSRFVEFWNIAREKREREYQKVVTSIKIIGDSPSIEELIFKLSELNKIIAEWMCPLDKRRIHDIVNSIVPAIDSYIKSSGYRNKETNRSYANGLVLQLIDNIKERPTKISYEAMLPLVERVQELLSISFAEVVKMSEPKLSVQMLATENVVNENRVVPIQISVANHRDSSPIREVSVSVENTEDVRLVESAATAYNALDGGDEIIFKLKVEVSEQVLERTATVMTVICNYKSGELQKEYQTQMSLRLYSSDHFTPIANPYAPVADGGPVPIGSNMFYGREEFISNIVDAIIKSPSKQVIIYGQKRCGKSSVLLHLQKQLNTTGRAFCVSFSLGEITSNLSEASFYHKVLSSIKTELDFLQIDNSIVPDITFPSWNEFKQEDSENPLNTFMKYMIQFKLACKRTPSWENKNLVVMIDEFTYLYSGIKKGEVSNSIMKQWKAITQNERAQFSVVLVGQDVVPSFKKEDYASNAFGVIEDIRLTYLKEEPARDLIEKPILNEKGESRYIGNAVSRIIDYTSRNPYYIQIFCDRLVDTMNRNKAICVTEADVNDVARTFIEGSDALPEDKFDNLIRAGESEDLQEYSEKDILAVLRQIAICSKNIGYCNRNDVRVLEDKAEEDAIFKHLYDREVLEQKGDNNYKIQVKLFQEWLLNH